MHDCIFCKIGKGEVPSDTVFETNGVRVFKDIHPKAPTHFLVIPKTHIGSIAELDDNDQHVLVEMIYTAKRVAESLQLKGYKLVFNVGREGGQVVDHLHLHVLGGWREGKDQDII